MIRLLVALPVLACLLAPELALGWTAPFHERVAEQSARLMPPTLQSVLAKNVERLREGARAPLSLAGHESLYLHAGGSYGRLDESIQVQCQRILDALGQRAPMSVVAYEFGVLSHYVALAQDPLHAAADDPREAEWGGRFHRYAEARTDRFRVVFDGYLSAPLEQGDVRGFVHGICNRSRRHYPILARSYVTENGTVARNTNFDDRHPVFGIATLGYARGISDTAKLWLWVWIRAGGDTRGLPFPQGLRNVPTTSQEMGQ